jgi:hypothetical protein
MRAALIGERSFSLSSVRGKFSAGCVQKILPVTPAVRQVRI